MDSGELREGSSFGKGQMVAADYTMNPSINFSQSNAGGIGGVLGAFGGRLGAVGAVVGGLKFKKAETMLTMIDNRSIGFALGASEYMTKPIDRARLASLLARFAGQRSKGLVLIVDDDADVRTILRASVEGRVPGL